MSMADLGQGIWAGLAGGMIAVAGQLVVHWVKGWPEQRLKDGRKKLLRDMLNDSRFEWRKLSTMSHVIGSTKENTAILLIEMGCRADERGGEGWAYIKDKPISSINAEDISAM
ncbi:hypothetical protein [Sphingobium sp. DN12]|uniref:hypothetical protein n=1 Tax=Sphingobium sp. DN12 TaxID=3378073 RepID=UPI003DA46C30